MQGAGMVDVFTNQGNGQFALTETIPVGISSTGLSMVTSSSTGNINLLVGDTLGDVLLLEGDGTGNFTPPPPLTGSEAPLDVQPSNGQTEVIVANQAANAVTIQALANGSTQTTQVGSLNAPPGALLAPGAVQFVKLDPTSPYDDAVVAASGSNSVLVYQGIGLDSSGNELFNPTPQVYQVGTDPVSVTAANLSGNRNGALDLLVVNKGSNDISELVGSINSAGGWTATYGPRLASNGIAPIAVNVVPDSLSLGGFDLVVTNSQSGNVAILQGRGQGFFNDVKPIHSINLGGPVVQPPTFNGDAGVTINSKGELVGFDLANDTSLGVLATPITRSIDAVQATGTGSLVVAEQGGTVVELQPSGPDQYEVSQNFVSAGSSPGSPSALQVLQGPEGVEEVLVTNSGEGSVFVFTALGGPEGQGGSGQTLGQGVETTTLLEQTGALALETGSSTSASTSAAGEGSLVLIVTLGANALLGGENALGGESSSSAVLQTALSQLNQQTQQTNPGGDDEVAGEEIAFAESPTIRPNVEGPLRKLEFDKKPEEIDPLKPLSRQARPDGSLDLEGALVDLEAGPIVAVNEVAPDLAASLVESAAPEVAAPDCDLVWLEELQNGECRLQNKEKKAEEGGSLSSPHSAFSILHSAIPTGVLADDRDGGRLLLAVLAMHGLTLRELGSSDRGYSGRQRQEKRPRHPRAW
jgi:hypothetical protein